MRRAFRQHISLFWLLHLGGWLTFGLAMTFSRIGIYPLWYMAVEKGILTVLGIGFSLLLRGVYRRVRRRSPSLLGIISLSVFGSYLLSLLWTATFNVAMDTFMSWYQSQPFAVENWFQLVSGSLYHAFVLMSWSVLYFGIKHYQDLQQERERALKAEAQAQQAQLAALRYQLNPHFLFNTLNAISTLVAEERNQDARRMIARLSEFFRLTLEQSNAQEVPLVEELAFVRRYLEIEQIRFAERLSVRMDADPETYAALVPTLILQPLVENAIKHAIAPRETGGQIEIEARYVGGRLHLRVRDDGPGMSKGGTDAERYGVGLTNTQARLEVLYGTDQRLGLRRADGGGVEVTLDVPYRTAAEDGRTEPRAQTASHERSTESTYGHAYTDRG